MVTFLLVVGVGYYFWSKGGTSFSLKTVSPQVAEIQKKGKLIVATDATYPPLEYEDKDKKIIGFDIDLANKIASDLGVPLEVKNISFDKIFDSLKNGEVDLVISSVTITQERQKLMDFSSPYLNAGQIIVVKSSDQKIGEVIDLKDKKVGVQKDTTSETEALKYTKLVKTYPDYNQTKTDLISGKIDAIIIDYPAAIAMAQESKEQLKVIGKPFTSEFYGVVVAKGNSGLVDAVNETLANLKRTSELNRVEELWFKR